MNFKRDVPAGAPAWVLSYGDMMSLLLCLFILLASVSEIRTDDKFKQAAQSLRDAFGFSPSDGVRPGATPASSPLIQQLRELAIADRSAGAAASGAESVDEAAFSVSDVSNGILIELAGETSFDSSSPVLKPLAVDWVRRTAEKLRFRDGTLQITGHAGNEALPEGRGLALPMDLAYARGRAVAEELMGHGIDPGRIRIVALPAAGPRGDAENQGADDRRVEIVLAGARPED